MIQIASQPSRLRSKCSICFRRFESRRWSPLGPGSFKRIFELWSGLPESTRTRTTDRVDTAVLSSSIRSHFPEKKTGVITQFTLKTQVLLCQSERMLGEIAPMIYWVDAKVSADFFSFLCFKFLLKQNTINQQRIYHCYL